MRKSLPGIDQVLLYPEVAALCEAYSRELAADWARAAVEGLRKEIEDGASFPLGPDGKVSSAVVVARVLAMEADLLCPSLKIVVNATGIVIHTNLGRAPLSGRLIEVMTEMLGSYSNLEYDLAQGKRGSRHVHLERLITAVTGAPAGFVVNNNAAAVMVALNTLAAGREVIVSRGELIEIGGSFRMPDIIERGGALIREVGTTNKTRISDYEKALGSGTALLLKVHTSNYRVTGFTEEASLAELVELGKQSDVPVMLDLGSGLLTDLAAHGITAEKPVNEYVALGPDVVTFSGDKMLGGPQAGFIVGKAEMVERIKQNPMVRALRVGKITVAMLESLLSAYLSPQDLIENVPVLGLLTRDSKRIENAARRLARELKKRVPQWEVKVEKDQAFAGGGSLPAEPLPTSVVSIEAPGLGADALARAMREARVPVIGRIKGGRFCIDLRTVLPGDSSLILEAAASINAARP